MKEQTSHTLFLVGKGKLDLKMLVHSECEQTVLDINEIRNDISILINSFGGRASLGEKINNEIKAARQMGDTIRAFAYPEALSAAATILISADESYVTDDTKILFHAAYQTAVDPISSLYFSQSTNLHGLPIYTSHITDQIQENREQLQLSTNISKQKIESLIAQACRENPYYPEIVLSGKEAADCGLVTKSFPTIAGLTEHMSHFIPSELLEHTHIQPFLS